MTNKEAKEILLDMANELQLFPESRQGQAFKVALRVLDNENVLDKIRKEIEELKPNNPNFKGYFEQNVALNKVLEIIDKYRGE